MKHVIIWICICVQISLTMQAQDQQTYQRPPKVMEDLLLAPATPSITIRQNGKWMLLTERSSYPSLSELAEPEVRVGGLRMNPANFSPSRSPVIIRMQLKNLQQNKEVPITGLPKNLRAGYVQWSPDESQLAFVHLTAQRADLYLVNISSATARKINTAPLNAMLSSPYTWVGNRTLIYKTVAASKGAMPVKNPVPASPVIQENLGKPSASRTYQDLIKNPYDEALFEWLTTSQLVINDLKAEKPIGKPAIIANLSVSPDQTQVLMTYIQKPFSYLVQSDGFPKRITVLNLSDFREWTVAETPSEEGAPIGFDDVPDFPRRYAWRSDKPATLTYIKALDKGLGRSKAAFRDAIYTIDVRGDRSHKLLLQTRMRCNGVTWGDDSHAIVYENMFANRRMRMSLFNPADGRMDSLFERSSNDAYSDIGTPLTHTNSWGREVLLIRNKDEILLRAQGASPDGDMPLLQSMNLKNKVLNKIWQSQSPYYEQFIDLIDPEKLIILTSRESNTETPNYFIRDLSIVPQKITAITAFPNPYPQLEGVAKQKVSYQRADGIRLTGDLYLPKGYDAVKQGPLPVLIWAYPREYRSAADAAQVRGSKHTFTRIGWGSPIYWVTQGYAVLDNAEMPIVGEGKAEPNDSFIPQLYLNAHAAIQYLARIGVGDSTRVGVGGHSYGAFMTANLLAHTSLFRAGIARSGAYNRTLTPFGFQAEERTYWEAPQVYFQMSPFSFSDKLKTPILLIHGEMDNNSGTFPIQSERFYNALKGHGATVRYVQLPYESHGYQARENLLHTLWEQHQWLERYVKNAGR